MLEKSSDSSTLPAAEFADAASARWSRPAKVAMLLLNALPFCHVTTIVIGAALVHGALARASVLIGGIYLAPPVLVRLLLWARPLRAGSFRLDAPEFLRWWASAQGQILFSRFPFLEEILRLAPGFYSAWLRLWGSKVGRLTYWAPGVRILDRSLLEIGDDVIFGVGVRLSPHVLADDKSGATHLHVGPVRIGSGCRVGGYSMLTAGTIVEPKQALKAFSLSPPFTTWRAGRRGKIAIPQ
jgi:hypothetical protein